MLTITTTDHRQQAEILKAIDSQPHITLCLQAVTEDQKQTVSEVRAHFQAIKRVLASYFSGQRNPIADPKEKRFIDTEIDCYLKIYSLIWFGWDAIEAAAIKKFPEGKDTIAALSPGEFFTLYLDLECENMVAVALTSGTVSSHESYCLLSGLPEVSKSSGLQAKRDRHTLEYADQVKARSSGAAELLEFCENAVKQRLRGNPTLKGKLAEFRSVRSKRLQSLRRILKTSKVRGETWDSGLKKLA